MPKLTLASRPWAAAACFEVFPRRNWRTRAGGDNRIRVFRLLKLVLFLGALGAGVYYGTTVKLGDRTLYQHLRAIWETRETKELRRGTKDRVGGLVDDATDKVVKGVSERAPGKVIMRGDTTKEENAVPTQPPQENVSPEDRKALRNIIGQGRYKPSE
jgi:hypothetical protein